MSNENHRKLIFEKPKFQSCYLPCSFKERYERIATEQLLSLHLDEEVNSNTDGDCPNFFGVSWSEKKQEETIVKDEKEDFGDLLYSAVHSDHDCKQSKGALTGWETCDSQKGHDKGYLKEHCSWKQVPPRRQFSSRKPDKRRLQLNFDKQPISIHSDTRKCDRFEEKTPEKEVSVELNVKEDNARAYQTRSALPHNILTFRRFSNPRDFITYYRDNITYFMIHQHLCRYVTNWQAAKSFKKPTHPTTREKEPTPAVENTKKTQIFRLQISGEKKQGFGVLRVGPCPRTEASKRNEFLPNSKEEEKVYNKDEKLFYREKTPEALEISITGSKPPSSDIHIETNIAQRKLAKTKMSKTMIIPKASNVDLSKSGSLRGKDDYKLNDSGKDKVKTVELQIVKAATGSRAKGAAKKLNRPKNKPTPPPTSKPTVKKTSPAHNACQPHIVCGSNMTKMIFADKQFLHITTPKPIGVNPANQRGSTSKLFDATNDTIYPWAETLSVIPRGRLIDKSQILSPYLHRYPDKGFQACITPSSYPSSSIDIQIQGSALDESSSLELCRSEEDIHKISSKKSVQNVGPFLKL